MKSAFFIVWCVLSCVIVVIMVIPHIVPLSFINGSIPPCSAKLKGGTCSLCGMTTAFYHIAAGEFGEAGGANPRSIPLYFVFLMDLAILTGFIIHKILRRYYL